MGCSWGRFTDIGENRPVVMLEKPSDFKSGFGVNVTPLSLGDEESRVLVGQAPGRFNAAPIRIPMPSTPRAATLRKNSIRVFWRTK
jgi:hypothetical protein